LAPILSAELRGKYREPFFGGGAVFFQLRPRQAVISDVNPELIAFLKCLAHSPEEIVECVWRWTNARKCYDAVREARPRSPIGASARFLYLNRTCWGGIYRTNRAGEFNVPFGDSGRVICRRRQVLACASALQGVDIVGLDFADAVSAAEKGDVVYADPPYTTKGENNGFVRYNERLFSWDDQVRLAKVCSSARSRGAFVAASGLWHPELLKLYRGWWAWKVERVCRVSRTINARGSVNEAVLFSRFSECAKSQGVELERLT
jgi:DNA adenine methylase